MLHTINGRRPARIVELSEGHYVSLSEFAFILYEANRTRRTLEETALELSTFLQKQISPAEVSVAQTRLKDQLAAELKTKKRSSLFLFRFRIFPDSFVASVAGRLTWLFEPLPAATIVPAAILAVGLAFRAGAENAINVGGVVPWILAYLIFLSIAVIHEFGHAVACTTFGVRPSEIGLTAYFVFPAFYSDVSRAWSLPRWKRLAVDLGGIYAECAPLAIVALLAAITHNAVLLRAVVLVVGGIAFNLNPIFRFDGYWALADALDVPRLAAQPLRLLERIRSQGFVAAMEGAVVRSTVVLLYAMLNAVAWMYFTIFAATTVLGAPRLIGRFETFATLHSLRLQDAFALAMALMAVTISILGLWRMITLLVRFARVRMRAIDA